MAKINIGFDIDGVALRYTERHAEVFKLLGGKTDLSAPKEFNFFNLIKEEEQKALYLTFGYMMQEILPVHYDFGRVMRFMIHEERQKMQFITARSTNLSKDSAVQSLENAVSYMGVAPSQMKHVFDVKCVEGHSSKVPLIKEYGMEYFVEDRRKNVLEMSQAGITVFMPRRSWNELPEDTTNVIQYSNAIEIIMYLRNM